MTGKVIIKVDDYRHRATMGREDSTDERVQLMDVVVKYFLDATMLITIKRPKERVVRAKGMDDNIWGLSAQLGGVYPIFDQSHCLTGRRAPDESEAKE